MSFLRTFAELGLFVVTYRRWVLLPVLGVLFILGLFVVLAEIPVLAPFVYALF